MNESSANARFGPFLVTAPFRTLRRIELCHGTMFEGDGRRRPVVLRRTRRHDDGMHERFVHAASHYAVLRHPSIAEVVDFGALDGRSYVATRRVEGRDLLRVLGRCANKRIGFPTDVALFIVHRVLQALACAHEARTRDGRPLHLAHQDISHSNIIVTAGGHVAVTDFGMRLGSTRRRGPRGANVGANDGFASYAAPEQIRGTFDHRADLFSVGVVLYELVTGRVLFKGTDETQLLEQVSSGRFEVPLADHRRDLHPTLSWIVHKALAPDPEDRFASARAFSDAVEGLMASVDATLDPQFLARLMRRLFSPNPSAVEAA